MGAGTGVNVAGEAVGRGVGATSVAVTDGVCGGVAGTAATLAGGAVVGVNVAVDTEVTGAVASTIPAAGAGDGAWTQAEARMARTPNARTRRMVLLHLLRICLAEKPGTQARGRQTSQEWVRPPGAVGDSPLPDHLHPAAADPHNGRPMTDQPRPDMDHYMMGIALAVRSRANCLGSKVGAVIAVDRRIVSTGYNGTPTGMRNCDQGGCDRCADPRRFPPGTAYDVCICVHAEQNALLAAARFGIPVAGSTIYTTLRPCFGCFKELLQAQVLAVRYLHEWAPRDPSLRNEYERLVSAFAGGVQLVAIDDPDRSWAMPAGRVSGNPAPQAQERPS